MVIKEGKQATHWTRLSCHRFRANEVRLQLSVLAYNLGNLWRRLVLPPRVTRWSLTRLQQRLVKTGGRLVKHARYYWLLPGGRASDRTAVRRHVAEDLGAAGAGRLTRGTGNAVRLAKKCPSVERCLRNAGKTGPPVDRTSPRAELTASEAGRCCDEQEFRALGGLRVFKGAIWGRQIGNPGYHLPLRQPEGFLHALFGIMRLDLSVPDYTTLSRRSQHLRHCLRPVPAGVVGGSSTLASISQA